MVLPKPFKKPSAQRNQNLMARSGSEVVFTKPLPHAHSAAVERYIQGIEVRANGQKRINDEAKRLREHFDHMMNTRVQ